MYFKRIKDLREDNDLNQNQISEMLNVNRSTYANWENGDSLIPLNKLDELSLIYKKTLTYILNLEKESQETITIKKMDYNYLINKLNLLRKQNNYSYQDIATELGVSVVCSYKYHKKLIYIPLDKLIKLSKFYKINLDKLCNKI